jgi:hypothetical protein
MVEMSGVRGGVMKRALMSLVVLIPCFLSVGGCGPSDGELKIEDLREENRVEAERAVGVRRMEEVEHDQKEAAIAAYQEWFMHEMREPSSRPRKDKDSLERVSLEGTTLVVELSTDNKVAAIELCHLTLDKWSDPGTARRFRDSRGRRCRIVRNAEQNETVSVGSSRAAKRAARYRLSSGRSNSGHERFNQAEPETAVKVPTGPTKARSWRARFRQKNQRYFRSSWKVDLVPSQRSTFGNRIPGSVMAHPRHS